MGGYAGVYGKLARQPQKTVKGKREMKTVFGMGVLSIGLGVLLVALLTAQYTVAFGAALLLVLFTMTDGKETA